MSENSEGANVKEHLAVSIPADIIKQLDTLNRINTGVATNKRVVCTEVRYYEGSPGYVGRPAQASAGSASTLVGQGSVASSPSVASIGSVPAIGVHSSHGSVSFIASQASLAAVPAKAAGTSSQGSTSLIAGISAIDGYYEAYVKNSVNLNSFVSALQAVSTGGSYQLAHGLGVVPDAVTVLLIANADDSGYLAGASIVYSTSGANIDDHGLVVTSDSTNIDVQYGNSASVFRILDNTGESTLLNNSKWDTKIIATSF